MSLTYRTAGVDIDAGDEVVRRIKGIARSTFNRNVLRDIGLFGAFFEARFPGLRKPVLVSSVDGVGTKLKVAFMMEKHDTIGQDLVNHCVNDIAVCGATPLFFMDYFATGKLRPAVAADVVGGLAKACRENGCALIGGETAEMPGFYREGEYDIAGMIVGIAEKRKIIDGENVRAGDVLIALPSTGLHTNGFSLARKVLFERHDVDDYIDELGMRLGDALLSVHRSYLKPVTKIRDHPAVHGISHVTGGGIIGNTSRVMRKGLKVKIDWNSWMRPPIFGLIQKEGEVPEEDMQRTFNLGIGLIIVAAKKGADSIPRALRRRKENAFVVGEVVKGA